MATVRLYFLAFGEILLFLVTGFIVTANVLKYVYESAGIAFLGNVWITWFALSFFLYGIYLFVLSFVFAKDHPIREERMSPTTFWLLFIVSVLILLRPLAEGEMPF
jgi:hypothetical protein